jgi:predicted nucleotidyltransferase
MSSVLDGFDFSRLKQRWQAQRAAAACCSSEARRAVRERGVPLLRRYGVREAYLFGSVASGTAGPGSDIDVLAIPVDADRFWALRRDLEAALGRPLDLYTQADDPNFVRKIIDRGELLYAIQP